MGGRFKLVVSFGRAVFFVIVRRMNGFQIVLRSGYVTLLMSVVRQSVELHSIYKERYLCGL